MKMILCGRCMCIRPLKARHMCGACYAWWHRKQANLRGRVGRERAEEYEHLLPAYGSAFDALAERLGLKPDSLEKSLRRSGYRVVRSEGGGRKVFGRGDCQV